ncbi:MAG: hypothetical protein KF723_22520 [Rhizobiaceae bacterium]|nr:hypothetical protein [Rhizobiaceae bacterium]
MNKNHYKRCNRFRQQRGVCYFCPRRMRLLSGLRGRLPDDAATLYHLDTRYDEDRGQYVGQRRTVLACAACAREVSAERQDIIPIEELHRRSGFDPGRRAAWEARAS